MDKNDRARAVMLMQAGDGWSKHIRPDLEKSMDSLTNIKTLRGLLKAGNHEQIAHNIIEADVYRKLIRLIEKEAEDARRPEQKE